MRRVALGRRNYLFAGADSGGECATGIYSLIDTAKLRAVLKFADRHFVMEKGKVVWQGSSTQLRAEPGIVQQYLGVS